MAHAVPTRLTDADFERAARALDADEAAVRAIAAVESRGSGFLPSGEPKILFERHIFSRLTRGKFDKTHPDISFPKWIPGSYGPENTQHARMARAATLDREAALQSASWGAFQIMGFHWRRCGFKSLQAFVNAMYASAAAQLDATVAFIRAEPPMHAAVRARDWARFARLYNGPGYAQNKYDTKLAAAYKKHGGRA